MLLFRILLSILPQRGDHHTWWKKGRRNNLLCFIHLHSIFPVVRSHPELFEVLRKTLNAAYFSQNGSKWWQWSCYIGKEHKNHIPLFRTSVNSLQVVVDHICDIVDYEMTNIIPPQPETESKQATLVDNISSTHYTLDSLLMCKK